MAGTSPGMTDDVRFRPNPRLRSSAAALPLLGRLRNLLFFGNPLGAMRPASARLPRQSLSSFIGSVKLRPAASVQDRPASAVNVVTSERPFSL